MEMLLPRYGAGALADVGPSLLASLGVGGAVDTLRLGEARGVCLLLVDGLGWRLLRAHGEEAPFLSSLAKGSEPITAGFPATTATSIAAIGTGLPAGRHGIVGYTFATGDGELLNALSWRSHGERPQVDLRERFVPEQAQPLPTVWQRAVDAGVRVVHAVPHDLAESGLTRAVMRGGDPHGVHALGDLASTAVTAMTGGGRSLCYAYHADLDLLGHVYGPGSFPWRLQLAHIDRLATAIAEGLPSDCLLVVTADHGMVMASEHGRVDADTEPALREGIRLLGGEARVRYVYTENGATADVLAAWREVLGDRAWIVTRDEAVATGWFGPVVDDRVRERIGDLVVAARAGTTVVRTVTERRLSRMLGHHGSLTEDEQLVPLLTVWGD
ncbi:MAG: alkaline phosphatase family protein [Sciscionella sp.]